MNKNRGRFLKRWISMSLVTGICGFFSVVISSSAPQEKLKESILHLKIESIRVENVNMEEALRLLRQKGTSRILIGFEKIPHWEGEKDKKISFELINTTVEDILNRLCEADARYAYEVVNDVLINVFPVEAKSDPNNLLNIKVRNFEVDECVLLANLVLQIGERAPELKEYLSMKAEEYARKRGRPTGNAGSILSGNSPLPKISLKLENVTVREILNAIVLYDLKLYHEQKRPEGWPPIGWKYEFIIDPDAPTGLGGYPRWEMF